jgi:TRAP-type C4-dicarboxylate transport system substrate-binding protein
MAHTIHTFLLVLVVLVTFASDANTQVLKVATLATDGTVWMKELRQSAAVIKRRTQEQVRFKFYPGGVMGSDKSVLRKLRVGQLHGAAISSAALARVYPDSQTYGWPLLFRSHEEVDYVRAHTDTLIINELKKRGYVSFGIVENGFAYLLSNRPVRRVSDLKGQKVWVPEGDLISRTFYEAAGRSPIPLPLSDVLTGLQTGLIETVGTPPIGAIALQWHTAVKYLTDTPVMYTYGMLIMDSRIFGQLHRDHQAVVREVIEHSVDKLNKQNRVDNEKAKQALKNQGITFIRASPKDLDKLRSIAAEARRRLVEKGIYSPTVLEALKTHLSIYRDKHEAGSTGR